MAGSVGLVISDRFLEHDTGPHHPERPERLAAVRDRLSRSGLLADLDPIAFDSIDRSILERVHVPNYVERFHRACQHGRSSLDTPDCPICPASYDRLPLLAAGGAVAAVDAVMRERVRRAFCCVRPPGHHAERDHAMGFCFFNNIALAAERARSAHGIERIAILDWDVHHGNGTQNHFEADPHVFFSSIHQHPATLYPGTGFGSERGVDAGEGQTLNVPMSPGSGDAEYRRAFDETILPAIDAFRPQLLLISAGFDAHERDPLANIRLQTASFAWMTRALIKLAEQHCGGRLVSVLEGGYDLDALADCVQTHVGELFPHP